MKSTLSLMLVALGPVAKYRYTAVLVVAGVGSALKNSAVPPYRRQTSKYYTSDKVVFDMCYLLMIHTSRFSIG